jgi:hypothetical protein
VRLYICGGRRLKNWGFAFFTALIFAELLTFTVDNGQGVVAIASLCVYKYQLVTQISRNNFSVWPNLVWS